MDGPGPGGGVDKKEVVSILCSQGVDTVDVIGEGGGMGQWGHGAWAQGSRQLQTTVTYLGRYTQAQVPQCM